MKKFLLGAVAAVAVTASPAQAAKFIVDATANSSSGSGAAPLATGITFQAGDVFRVFTRANDLWSAGALPRWSTADGLTGNLFATGNDESGEAAGTLIGQSFGTHTQDGFTAPFGALVGRINGVYQVLGTDFNGPAWASGELQLLYWDSNNNDNSQFVTAAVAGIPEPATWAMMIMGFGLIGWTLRRAKPRVTFSYA